MKKYSNILNESCYMKGDVKYSWIKKRIKDVTNIEPEGGRINILVKRIKN
jgi:hypothetical protein